MVIRFKSVRQNNIIGLMMIYPDGHPRNVLMAELPMDGDWRADVDFYDEIEQAYKSVCAEHFKTKYNSTHAKALPQR